MTTLSYFAKDGNYGDADKITIVDTAEWTGTDWDLIEESPEDMRYLAARVVSEWVAAGRDDSFDGYFDRLGVTRSNAEEAEAE